MTILHRAPTICLLGGTGFVGRHLTAQLVRQGCLVRIPTRSRQRNRDMLVLPGAELVQADIFHEPTLGRLLRGCDAAVNLVGIFNEKGHDGSGFKRVHVELTEMLIRACHENGVPRLMHMSALKANAERGASHFLKTKGQAEQLVRKLSGDEIRYTIFKPAAIFGEGDSFVNRLAKLLRRMPILPLAQPNARFAPVFVGDVVAAFAKTLHDPAAFGRSYELCGPEIYSLREIVEFVRRELGLRRLIVPLPPLLGRLQAAIADYLIPGKPFSLDNLRSLSVANVCNENGLQALGIAARSMSAAVPRYLAPRPAPRSGMRHAVGD